MHQIRRSTLIVKFLIQEAKWRAGRNEINIFIPIKIFTQICSEKKGFKAPSKTVYLEKQ